MKIDSYSFGKIVINGKTYASDVIIYPGCVPMGSSPPFPCKFFVFDRHRGVYLR